MEIDALGLERKPAEIQHAAYIDLQVVDDILMPDPQYPTGQHLIPVPHQIEIRSVVPSDIVDAVGELLTIGEQLFQISEAASHRLAPRIDELCIRQHQMDQADMPEV